MSKSFIAKKYLPSEKRTWPIFCMDIWKQFTASFFAHFLNMVLAVLLEKFTGKGDGCVWYFTNHTLDCFLGSVLNFAMFQLVDSYAVKHGIEELKSGVYFQESVQMETDEEGNSFNESKHLDFRIWCLQVSVWCMINLTGKLLIFFGELIYYKPLLSTSTWCLSALNNHPNVELVLVMIILPVSFNSIQWWLQDTFLKGDDHTA